MRIERTLAFLVLALVWTSGAPVHAEELPVTASLSLGCSHRGGTYCFAADGSVLTPPPDNGLAIAKFSIPAGSVAFLATLTEYSGSTCNGGYALATVRVDGVEKKAFDLRMTENKEVVVELPSAAKVLELRTDAGGLNFCDDPIWKSPRFSVGAQPGFPVFLTAALQPECSNRGGTTCFHSNGGVITPPPDNRIGYARFKIPAGSLYFLSALTEYSGTSCNGGSATATVVVDGTVKATFPLGATDSKSVVVSLPSGAKLLELRTTADGDAWCDDPLWIEGRFSVAVASAFPVFLSAALQPECSNRGGTTCFSSGGVLTPPSDNGMAYARFKIPSGSLYFLATLTEYSGTGCNGGSATATVLVDGAVKATFPLGATENKPVAVSLPSGARLIELRTTADGDAWCDDPLWIEGRFSTSAP